MREEERRRRIARTSASVIVTLACCSVAHGMQEVYAIHSTICEIA